jgi:hypothetical protein
MFRRGSPLFFVCFIALSLFPPAIPAAPEKPDSESALLHAVARALEEQGVPFEERPLFAEFGGFGSSIHVRIPAAPNSENRAGERALVLAVPLSGAEEKDAAPSGGLARRLPFGVETALAFIRSAADSSFPQPVTLAFLGNETSRLPKDSRDPNFRLGLEDLYTTLEDPENTVLLYMDIAAPPQRVIIHHGAGRMISSRAALETLCRLWDAAPVPADLAVRFNELYKLGLVSGPDSIRSAHARLIDALYLAGETARSGDAAVAPADLARSLIDYAGALGGAAGSLDRHFLIASFGRKVFFVPESVTVMVFLGITGLFFMGVLTYFTLYRKRAVVLWRMFLGYAWVFPLFILALTVSLELAGFTVAAAGRLLGYGAARSDAGLAFLKIIIALPLFSALFSLGASFKIPQKAGFYGNSAVVLVIAGVLIAAVLDISFTPLFLWALLCAASGAAFKKPLMVYACVACAAISALGPLENILQSGGSPSAAGRFTEILLSQGVLTSLYIAVIILPFMLLLERGAALRERNQNAPSPMRRFAPIIACFAAGLGALCFYTLYRSKNQPPAPVRRTIEDERGMLAITVRERVFLERRSVTVTVSAQGDPLRFNLRLTCADQTLPVIYAAPMPYRADNDWKSIVFQAGEGPPNPFVTEIILPLDFTGSLEAEALYTVWDPIVDPLPPPETDDYILRVTQSAPIRPAQPPPSPQPPAVSNRAACCFVMVQHRVR